MLKRGLGPCSSPYQIIYRCRIFSHMISFFEIFSILGGALGGTDLRPIWALPGCILKQLCKARIVLLVYKHGLSDVVLVDLHLLAIFRIPTLRHIFYFKLTFPSPFLKLILWFSIGSLYSSKLHIFSMHSDSTATPFQK